MIKLSSSKTSSQHHATSESQNYYKPFSIMGFLCGSAGKESACNAEDLGSVPGLGRSPREGKGYPVQYSGLENSMDSPGSMGHRVRHD